MAPRPSALVMPDVTPAPLSRRERQILDVLYARGRATVAEVLAALPDAPSYSAVRALLRVLEDKGHVAHEEAGRSYVYRPAVARARARRSALRHLVETFFGGSAGQAAAALLDLDGPRLTPEEAAHLSDLIARAQRDGQ